MPQTIPATARCETPRTDRSAAGTPVRTIAIVGAGPRGTSVLERLSAYGEATPDIRLDVHVFDDSEPGPGEIWDPEQPRELQLNATAGQLTLFTDESITTATHQRPGPNLYEWARFVACNRRVYSDRDAAHDDASTPAATLFAAWTPPDFAIADDLLNLCRTITPTTFPPRALYGAYLRWFFAGALRTLPANMRVHVHRARVVGLRRGKPDGWHLDFRSEPHAATSERVAEGSEAGAKSLTADAVVLALGWVPNEPGTGIPDIPTAQKPAHPALMWLPPGHVLRHDLPRIPDGARVLVRGLGLTAIDVIARLTEGRGGTFTGAGSSTRYCASGREPMLFLTSPSGNPYRCKPADYGPEAADHSVLQAAIAQAGESLDATGRPVDFSATLYPAVLADAAIAYYRARVRLGGAGRGGASNTAGRATGAVPDPAVPDPAATDPSAATEALCAAIARTGNPDTVAPALVEAACPDPDERFDATWLRPRPPESFPAGMTYARWLRDFMAADAARAEAGPSLAINAAIGSVSAARTPLARFTRGRVLTAESFRDDYQPFRTLGGRLGGGPPPERYRQLVALMDAEVVVGLGAGVELGAAPSTGRDQPVPLDAVVDAWLANPTLHGSADPLVRDMCAARLVRRSRLPSVAGGTARTGSDASTAGTARTGSTIDTDNDTVETDSIDITSDNRVIAADGQAWATLFSLGLPNDDVSGHSFISPHPGAGAMFLRETDHVARLLTAPGAAP